MRQVRRSFLFWIPRVLGLLFAAFVSIFALDVFGEGYSFWETARALFMHLIPVYVLLNALAIGWKWEWAGALLFLAFSFIYIWMAWRPVPVIDNFIFMWPIAVPPLLIALFFLISWANQRRVAT